MSCQHIQRRPSSPCCSTPKAACEKITITLPSAVSSGACLPALFDRDVGAQASTQRSTKSQKREQHIMHAAAVVRASLFLAAL